VLSRDAERRSTKEGFMIQIETDESGQVGKDGAWFCDPDVAERELNEYGEMNSLLQLP
jgi:hypothetical protein